jgi:hypothetical protein
MTINLLLIFAIVAVCAYAVLHDVHIDRRDE